MDELHASRDRRAEADAVIGSEHIVVHCFGYGDYFDAFAMQSLSVAESVVAANRHEDFDAKVLEILQNVRGAIFCTAVCILAILSFAQKLRQLFKSHL